MAPVRAQRCCVPGGEEGYDVSTDVVKGASVGRTGIAESHREHVRRGPLACRPVRRGQRSALLGARRALSVA
jgi:hypothetical protein